MHITVRSGVALLATVALTLSLAACGDKESSDATVDAATATDAAEPKVDTSSDPAATSDAASGDTGTASNSDVCRLLDNETITSITGVDFSAAVATDDGSGTCDWDITETGGLAMVTVIVAENLDSTYEINKGVAESMFDDVTEVSVSGVDNAFMYMGGLAVAMDFGDQYVQVLFMSFGDDVVPEGAIIKLSEEVASNW